MLVAGLITIVGGLLAASGFILKRLPNASVVIEKVAPYQGWIGAVMFCWGVKETISTVLNIGMIGSQPVSFLFLAFNAAVDLIVGGLLGFNIINHYVLSRNASAQAKGAILRDKAITYQVPAGISALVLGALLLIYPYVA